MHVQKTAEEKLAPTTLYGKAKLRTFTSFVRKYELEPQRKRVAGERVRLVAQMSTTRCPNEYDSLPQRVREQVQVGVRNDNFSMSYTIYLPSSPLFSTDTMSMKLILETYADMLCLIWT